MKSNIARKIILGSRPSRLARWQTEHIMELMQQVWPGLECQIVTLVTTGDIKLSQPLPEIGGKGLFTEELESALKSGEIDLAVHSLKDLPVEDAEGLVLGAISRRADARDVLVSNEGESLTQLKTGARVGTSSLRREVQLRALRPDLDIQSIRGNVETRIRKVRGGEYDAAVLAAAGLERLHMSDEISEYLTFDAMLPAPGQGALAVQCRADDMGLLELLQPVHDLPTFRAVSAERAFLAALGGGCSAPVAAWASADNEEIQITGLVGNVEKQQVIRVDACGEDPFTLGKLLAGKAFERGAAELLA